MKKLMIAAMTGLLIVSCGSKQEAKSVEEQANEYAAQLDSVAATGDSAAVVSLGKEIEQWQSSLSEEDQQKAAQLPGFQELVTKAKTVATGNVKQVIESAATQVAGQATQTAGEAVDAAGQAVSDAANAVVDEAKSQVNDVKQAAEKKASDAVSNTKKKANDAIDKAASDASKKASDAVKNAGNDAKKALGL